MNTINPYRFFFSFLTAFLIFAVSSYVFSENNINENSQKIIPLGSEVYDLVENLSLETGRPLLSRIKPWSEAEVFSVLGRIDPDTLSAAGVSALDRVNTLMEKSFIYEEDSFAADISLTTTLEMYLHTSEDESQWQYGYEERLPYLTLSAEVWFNRGFYAVIEPDLKESRFVIENVENNLTNLPKSWGDTNYHFPDRGFFSTGGENWNFQIGRDQLEYGNGETGKLMLSSCPDFYDFFKLKGFADNFAFTWTYINLESWSDSDHATRFISDHALEVRLFDLLTLYVNESALYDGEESQLQFWNPLTVYHNLFEHSFTGDTAGANIYMTLGFDVVPVAGFSLYGEYLLDELQTFIEQSEYGDAVFSTPNAFAYMLGTKGSLPIRNGYLSVFFEYIYTSPWCYLLDPDGGKIAWTHRETTDVLNKRMQVIKPIGYKYGPDTVSFSLNAAYRVPASINLGLSADYILKGENTIETGYRTGYDAAAMKTPSGTSENKLVIDLNASYPIFSFLFVQSDLAYININNYNHIYGERFSDLQFSIGVVFSK